MGGDHAPGRGRRRRAAGGARHGLSVALVGPAADRRGRARAARRPSRRLPLHVVDAPDVVAMDEAPLAALRRKPRASVQVAAELVAQRRRARAASAPGTPARRSWRRTRRSACCRRRASRAGRDRAHARPARRAARRRRQRRLPARASRAVRRDGRGVRARRARPRPSRASGCSRSARKPARATTSSARRTRCWPPRRSTFIGNLEARELFTGRADVIVCDGFTGNIALKVGEGLVELDRARCCARSWAPTRHRVGAALARRASSASGGASTTRSAAARRCSASAGLALVGHGRSSAQAVAERHRAWPHARRADAWSSGWPRRSRR